MNKSRVQKSHATVPLRPFQPYATMFRPIQPGETVPLKYAGNKLI